MSITLHTNLGDVKLELACTEVPKVCFNFLALAASGYYDKKTFHRNIPGFMIQGGKSKGEEESVWGGKFADQFHKKIRHDERGIVSMANKGPNTNGAQFFITYAPAPHLDDVYCSFGKVIKGMEVVNQMEKVESGKKNKPLSPIIIESVTIHANPFADEQQL